MYQSSSPSPSPFYPSMSTTSIQGHPLEVTVVGCNKLKDTEWISRQDPYVCLEYGSTKFRTRTCKDGGKNPTFQEKFVFTLIEGLRELNLVVWNSNTLTYDDFIGSGKAQLQKVLSQGYDDSPWSLQTKSGRYAGEARLIMHYANANLHKPPKNYAQLAPPYGASQVPQVSMYSAPPPASAAPYPPPVTAYPAPSHYHSLPPDSAAYRQPTYPPPPHSVAYPLQPYAQPSAYPPPPYPPLSQASPSYPPGPHPEIYPPPPGIYPPPPH